MPQFILLTLLTLIFSTSVVASTAALLIGNVAQQSQKIDGKSLDSDGHLGYGLGLIHAIALSPTLTWEFGATYLQRVVGTDDGNVLLSMPGFQFPIGIRFRVASFAISGGLYYWREAGKIQATGTGGGTYSELGYKNQHLGYYIGLVKGFGSSFFGEVRYAASAGNLSEETDVTLSMTEYQFILGTIIKFGAGGDERES